MKKRYYVLIFLLIPLVTAFVAIQCLDEKQPNFQIVDAKPLDAVIQLSMFYKTNKFEEVVINGSYNGDLISVDIFTEKPFPELKTIDNETDFSDWFVPTLANDVNVLFSEKKMDVFSGKARKIDGVWYVTICYTPKVEPQTEPVNPMLVSK